MHRTGFEHDILRDLVGRPAIKILADAGIELRRRRQQHKPPSLGRANLERPIQARNGHGNRILALDQLDASSYNRPPQRVGDDATHHHSAGGHSRHQNQNRGK